MSTYLEKYHDKYMIKAQNSWNKAHMLTVDAGDAMANKNYSHASDLFYKASVMFTDCGNINEIWGNSKIAHEAFSLSRISLMNMKYAEKLFRG